MPDAAAQVDTSSPHTARIYDYYLGGKNHFAADRETADKVLQIWPSIRVGAREQRMFLGRAVTAEHNPVGEDAVHTFHGAGLPGQLRDSGDFARLAFCGLDLVPPGVVLVSERRREGTGPRPLPSEVNCYGGVARKP